jgi:hypothetical protein
VPDEVTTALELVSDPAFQTGLVSAVAVLALLTIARLLGRLSSGWGLGLVSATLLTFWTAFQPDPLLSVALGLLFGGGLLVSRDGLRLRWVAALGWFGGTSGVVLLVVSLDLSDPAWMLLGLMVVTVAVAVGLHPSDRAASTLLGPLTAVSAIGIWATVPETDMVRGLVGASIGLAPATLWPWLARISGGGAMALAGLMGWLVVQGGATRASSVVGGWLAMALLAISARIEVRGKLGRGALIAAMHVLSVALAARVIGMMESTGSAALSASILAVALAIFAASMNRHPIRPTEGADDWG